MPVTVLFPEARQQPDEMERGVLGDDVRIVKRDTGALSELSDADCAEADGLMIMGFGVTGADLARFPKLRCIVRLGVGYDKLDRPAAAARNILRLQCPRLRHHRGRRPHGRPLALCLSGAASLLLPPDTPAARPAGAVALVPPRSDPAPRHPDLRHLRAGADRHGGGSARQGVQFPRRLLRSPAPERARGSGSASSAPRRSKTCCARPTRSRSIAR